VFGGMLVGHNSGGFRHRHYFSLPISVGITWAWQSWGSREQTSSQREILSIDNSGLHFRMD
jgi:hypothetical protein